MLIKNLIIRYFVTSLILCELTVLMWCEDKIICTCVLK